MKRNSVWYRISSIALYGSATLSGCIGGSAVAAALFFLFIWEPLHRSSIPLDWGALPASIFCAGIFLTSSALMVKMLSKKKRKKRKRPRHGLGIAICAMFSVLIYLFATGSVPVGYNEWGRLVVEAAILVAGFQLALALLEIRTRLRIAMIASSGTVLAIVAGIAKFNRQHYLLMLAIFLLVDLLIYAARRIRKKNRKKSPPPSIS